MENAEEHALKLQKFWRKEADDLMIKYLELRDNPDLYYARYRITVPFTDEQKRYQMACLGTRAHEIRRMANSLTELIFQIRNYDQRYQKRQEI